MPTVNWNEPCARAAALTQAYYAVVQGGGVTLIKRSGAGVEEEVRYGKADIQTLRIEMQRAQDECNQAQGQPARRRFAISVGARRRGGGPFGV